ncbi:MAG: DUF4349 domain-containing protein [Acholeplasmataceae bacterium]
MNKKIFFLLFIFLSVFLLTGCASDGSLDYESGVPENEAGDTLLIDQIPTRKIIYEVDLSIYTKDLEESIHTLKSNVEADEWFDYERIRETQATFKIRIKSDRLDAFIASIGDAFEVSSYSKTGTDISLEYLDITNRIAALQAQYDRLVDLYLNASLNDMITINTRLATIETELLGLQGTLNNFDSLVDYSEVNVSIYQSYVSSRDPFFNRLASAFVTGFNGVVSFFDGLLIVTATLLPFAVVFVPSGYGIYILVKRHQRKKTINKPKS